MHPFPRATLWAALFLLPVPLSLSQSPVRADLNAGQRLAAATPCAPRSIVVQQLRDGHGELPVAAGLVGTRGAVEVFASARGGFTIVFTDRNGRTCMIAAGEAWRRTRDLPVDKVH